MRISGFNSKFQFQSGTIKGVLQLGNVQVQQVFQFQSGTIKGAIEARSIISGMEFQFQSGTIKGFWRYFTRLLCRCVSIPIWYN